MTEEKQLKLGIIQSRGYGDIILALPIAHDYRQRGYEIHWPVLPEFIVGLAGAATWINWHPIQPDQEGRYFYDTPLKILNAQGCDEILPLYQSLSHHPEFSNANWFQIQKFDEYKYTQAGVPFIKKWTLSDCISRYPEREQALFDQVVALDPSLPYYVTHLKGSNFEARPDLSALPPEWIHISIDDNMTMTPFDWLTVIERSQAFIAVDSVMSNLWDQMMLEGPDLYWIPRSHIHLTPVLGQAWTILEAPENSLAAQKIFQTR